MTNDNNACFQAALFATTEEMGPVSIGMKTSNEINLESEVNFQPYLSILFLHVPVAVAIEFVEDVHAS